MHQRQLTFGEAVQRALTVNYCNFTGRSSRSEFWWFMLFGIIVSCVVSILFAWSDTLEYIVNGLVSLFFILPSLGLAIRRMHDTGRSGWWILVNLVPLVGWIIYLYFAAQDSQPMTNKWGLVPNISDSWN
ncbi:MAG: DUF805 domain-containing protein [Bacteroides sp.]|nr:DUF805 domain-containing protein [Bacteroides sp.]